MNFEYLIGIRDQLRSEVPHSVEMCHKAGITVRMVTGDNIITALAISKDSNIINEDQFNQIKKMAFEEKKSSVYVTSNENDKFEEDAHNDELNIFNKKNKKQSVDKLVEKILTDTNWHLKNYYKSKYDLSKK